MKSSQAAHIGNWSHARAACWPVGLEAIRLSGFLGERVARNNNDSIPQGFASPVAEPFALLNRNQPLQPIHLRFVQDTDTYKLIEGACYAYAYQPSEPLRASIERNLDEILQRELPGGGFVLPPRSQFDPKVYHELYAAGHLIEMACAHFQATGEERALNAACRWADMLRREKDAGNPYFSLVGSRDHPEIELALVRLSRATGQSQYLDLAAWIALQSKLKTPVSDIVAGGGKTHAVRVGYLMCGYAELYLETGDERFLAPLQPVWDEIRLTRMYLTGGLGANEDIQLQPFDLVQTGAIAETCASIAMMMLALRAQSLFPNPALFDVVETIFYNHFLGALSPEQDAVFYYNPLRQTHSSGIERNAGKSPFQRVKLPDLHGCSCCFPNVWRFLAQLPEYVLATDGKSVSVNLYTSAEADISLADNERVHISMQTDYPLGDKVQINVSHDIMLNLRIPGWCQNAHIRQGDTVRTASAGTFARVQAYPAVPLELQMPMQVRAISSDARILANLGQVAYSLGPLTYCYEVASANREQSIERVQALTGYVPKVSWVDGVPWLESELKRVTSPQSPYFSAEKVSSQAFSALLPPFYLHSNKEEDTHWTTWLPLG